MIFLSENLRLLRTANGLTMKELAILIGVQPSAYSNYESSVSNPNYDILGRICKILGVSADTILYTQMNDSDIEKTATTTPKSTPKPTPKQPEGLESSRDPATVEYQYHLRLLEAKDAVIAAKDAVIAAKDEAISALRLALHHAAPTKAKNG